MNIWILNWFWKRKIWYPNCMLNRVLLKTINNFHVYFVEMVKWRGNDCSHCCIICLATIFLPVWLFGPCLLSLVLQNTKLSERRKFPSHSRCVLLLRPAFVVRRFPGYSRECTRVATSIWLSVSYGPTFLVSHLRIKDTE